MECGSLCERLLPNCSAFSMVETTNTCELADASTIVVNPDPGDKAFIAEGFAAGNVT